MKEALILVMLAMPAQEQAIYKAMELVCNPYTTDCGFDPALHPPPRKPERE